MTRRSFAFLSAVVSLATAAEASRPARGNDVSVKPLFDTNQRFKPKQTFKLRFRATQKGAPVAAKDISFTLRHGGEQPLPVRQVKPGVFEVPFKPLGPGRYEVVPSVRGVPFESTPAVRLGVVGLADGIVEVPPEEDVEVMKHRGTFKGKSLR